MGCISDKFPDISVCVLNIIKIPTGIKVFLVSGVVRENVADGCVIVVACIFFIKIQSKAVLIAEALCVSVYPCE